MLETLDYIYYPYWQYTDLFIFRFLYFDLYLCLPSTLCLFNKSFTFTLHFSKYCVSEHANSLYIKYNCRNVSCIYVQKRLSIYFRFFQDLLELFQILVLFPNVSRVPATSEQVSVTQRVACVLTVTSAVLVIAVKDVSLTLLVHIAMSVLMAFTDWLTMTGTVNVSWTEIKWVVRRKNCLSQFRLVNFSSCSKDSGSKDYF